MSATYFCLFMLVLTRLMASGRPAEPIIQSASREPRQFAPWTQPNYYGIRQQQPNFDPIRERIAFAWLLSLLGGGGGGDGGDGDDDRFSWNIRPFASNLPNQPIINQRPFNYNWPVVTTSTLG